MKEIRNISPSLFARIFTQTVDYKSAEIRPEGICIKTVAETNTISFKQVSSVDVGNGLLWDSIELSLMAHEKVVLNGISKRNSSPMQQLLETKRNEFLSAVDLLQDRASRIRDLADWIDQGHQGKHWVANHNVIHTINETDFLRIALTIPLSYLTHDVSIQQAVGKVKAFSKDPEDFRHRANEEFVKAELDRFEQYFNTVESDPLTGSQRRAVITHEDNTRVIAGAGSGKTSVVVAKAGYLIKKGLCSSDQLLLVAFNRSAAQEMSERIREKLGTEIRATTFHALGLNIIGEVTGKKTRSRLVKYVEVAGELSL